MFYMAWEPWYITLIVISTLVDFFVARELKLASSVRTQRALLGLSLTVNLGLLFFFKYYDWLAASVNNWLDQTSTAHPRYRVADRH